MIRTALTLLSTTLLGSSVALAGLSSRTLTPDGTDTYSATVAGTSITVSAPASNVGSNLRRVYWPTGAPNQGNGRVCASWASQSHESVQQGTAHHITSTGALTVTKNVWAAAYWVFNVHVWAGPSFTQIAQFDMVNVMFVNGAYRPFPWRICTRVVGTVLTFKIWFPPEPEPSWTDPVRTRTATVPSGFGRLGWYAGHIPPGGSLSYTSVGAW